MISDLLAALRDARTYQPWRNGWALFGLAWGVPVPVFSCCLHWWLCGDWNAVAAAWPAHLIFLLHPPLFMLLFGAVGTVQRRKNEQLRVAMHRLEISAQSDALTGLSNRRHLHARLEEELERAKRSGEPVSVAMVDLDNFKPVNDRLGHLAGDEVLSEVARRLEKARREYDVLGRYGGDEFVFVLPSTDKVNALKVAARVLELVAKNEFKVPGIEHLPRLTASIGVASYPVDGETAQALLASSDQAMYLAKARGRNCIAMPEGVLRQGA